MSLVSNCILAFSILEDRDARIKQVNDFFEDERIVFVSVDEESLPKGWYGGTKIFETPLYLGAFNYLRDEELLLHMKNKVDWQYPERVQLIIQRQEEEIFSILTLAAAG